MGETTTASAKSRPTVSSPPQGGGVGTGLTGFAAKGFLTPPFGFAKLTIIQTNLGATVKTLPLSEVKAKLSGLVERVGNTDEEIVITKNGRPAAVLVSTDEYESWKETVAIRSNASLMKEIKASAAVFKAKKARLYTLDELFKK